MTNVFMIRSGLNKLSNFTWFVGHKDIQDGRAVPVNRGELEWYMNKCKKEIEKLRVTK